MSALPSTGLFRKSWTSSTVPIARDTMMNSSCGKIPADPICRTWSPNGEGNLICSGPQICTAAFFKMMLTATVLSTQLSDNAWRMTGRIATRSRPDAHQAGSDHHRDRQGDRVRQAERHIAGQPEQRADHQELALAEIQRAGGDEGDVVALGNQGIDAADGQPAHERLPDLDAKHRIHGTLRPPGSTRCRAERAAVIGLLGADQLAVTPDREEPGVAPERFVVVLVNGCGFILVTAS